MAKRRVAGLVTGEQRSPIQGGGIEFADYREYQPGDDIRQIDWAVFLRLRRLLVRLFAEEKELTLMLLMDVSQSMRFGKPDKLWFASRIAAILAGISIHGGNRAGILTMGAQLTELVPPVRTRSALADIARTLVNIQPSANFNPERSIRQFAARYGRRCMVVLLSDFLYPQWAETIRGLAISGCEGYVVQVLSSDELNPPQMGEVTLVDIESSRELPLHVGSEETRRYRQEMAGFLHELRQTTMRNGLGHTLVATDMPLARLFHHELRQGGLVC
jgi:uncharacterized protein (DUF58 family)